MNIAELFVNLGIKGSDKTLDGLGKTKKGLEDLKDTSFAAKAAIVGAMYALERLFATSGQAGTGLTNFTAMLGVSAKTLQEYQYAARQMGVTNEEVAGSFKSIQSAMSKTLMGENIPKGMDRVAMFTGGIKREDILAFQKNPELLMQKLQQYALKETNTGLRNEVLKGFGLGDSMVAAMSRNAFRPEVFKKAPTYSGNEIGQLDRANIAWSNLGTKIEMAVGHFNAKHGMQLVGDISKIVDQVVKLTEAFTILAEKLKIFQVIGKIFEGWGHIFDGITDAVDSLTGSVGSEPGKEPGKGGLSNLLTGGIGEGAASLKEALGDIFSNGNKNFADMIVPTVGPPPAQSGQGQNVEINQTLNFQHDGKDHKKTSDSVKTAVKQSYFQMAAQGQGT